MELLRISFDEKARISRVKVPVQLVAGTDATWTLPWREVITPHPDVASGKLRRCGVAAATSPRFDRGYMPTNEYADANAFFRRTYLTSGLRQLLLGALKRLSGQWRRSYC